VQQEIHFTRSRDGTRIAYANAGRGTPLVHAAHWLGHLEVDWRTPVWAPYFETLGARFRLTRYDARGCGLSDRDVADVSLERMVEDFSAVVDAARLDRFAIFAASQGGAVAATYASRHPERVSHLVFCGAYARGRLVRDPSPAQREMVDVLERLIRVGWGVPDSPFLKLFTNLFFPAATAEQAAAFDRVQKTTKPEHAAMILRGNAHIDASECLPAIRCPALVLHCLHDAIAPFEEGRFIASSVPNARLETLDSRNHVPLAGEPAFDRMMQLIFDFLGADTASRPGFDALTAREREALDLLARGLDNAQIAARLGLAEKTVRNRISQLFDKLGVETRAQAIVRAREAGFGA
jgi:pimeloyl-ACP methyl ester carboxylesterase/DNA-binding CsgD family transcriptional regulator